MECFFTIMGHLYIISFSMAIGGEHVNGIQYRSDILFCKTPIDFSSFELQAHVYNFHL